VLSSPAVSSGDGPAQTLDRTATLDAQLEWLRAAGFGHVRCAFRDERFAVYAGTR